jgi:erythromycin esterase-like protein
VNPSVSGQVEAAVMANDLVRFIQQEEASSGVFSRVVVNEAKDGPSNTIINGARDAGMAENIKILMDGKIPASGMGVYWGHNAHVGRISYLDGDPSGFPSTWGTTGSILSTWLGDAYAPLATITGVGTFRAHLMDASGIVSPFQPVTAPVILPECLNAIATKAFPTRPVFFQTTKVSMLHYTRPEFAVAGLYVAPRPNYCFIRTVPGMAYTGVISFPVSTAAHEMKR